MNLKTLGGKDVDTTLTSARIDLEYGLKTVDDRTRMWEYQNRPQPPKRNSFGMGNFAGVVLLSATALGVLATSTASKPDAEELKSRMVDLKVKDAAGLEDKGYSLSGPFEASKTELTTPITVQNEKNRDEIYSVTPQQWGEIKQEVGQILAVSTAGNGQRKTFPVKSGVKTPGL